MRLRVPEATSVLLVLYGTAILEGTPVLYIESLLDGVLHQTTWGDLRDGKHCRVEVPLNSVLTIKLTVDSVRHIHAAARELLITVTTRPHSCCMCGATATDRYPCNCFSTHGHISTPEAIERNNQRHGRAGAEPAAPAVRAVQDHVMSVASDDGDDAADDGDDAADDGDDVAADASGEDAADVEVFCE